MQLILGSAVVSTAVFGLWPKTSSFRQDSPNSDSAMGMAFRHVLDKNQDLHSLGEFSKRVDNFFATAVNNMLDLPEWNILYVVFSGGDDLLLVGPWDKTFDFAAEVRHRFNEEFSKDGLTISAGMAMIKPTIPIRDASEQADLLLDRAKTETALDCWAMTPICEIYLEGYRLRFPAEKTLPPSASTEERKAPAFRDDHYPQGFQDYVEKIWRENPWILSAHSLPYDRQPSTPCLIPLKTWRNQTIRNLYQFPQIIGTICLLLS
jgi:hypothetical protein